MDSSKRGTTTRKWSLGPLGAKGKIVELTSTNLDHNESWM